LLKRGRKPRVPCDLRKQSASTRGNDPSQRATHQLHPHPRSLSASQVTPSSSQCHLKGLYLKKHSHGKERMKQRHRSFQQRGTKRTKGSEKHEEGPREGNRRKKRGREKTGEAYCSPGARSPSLLLGRAGVTAGDSSGGGLAAMDPTKDTHVEVNKCAAKNTEVAASCYLVKWGCAAACNKFEILRRESFKQHRKSKEGRKKRRKEEGRKGSEKDQ
jgi:hypothetical protein